jgi:hypothetical protein
VSQDCGGATTAGTTSVVVTDHRVRGEEEVFSYPRPGRSVPLKWLYADTLVVTVPDVDEMDEWITVRMERRETWRTLQTEFVSR